MVSNLDFDKKRKFPKTTDFSMSSSVTQAPEEQEQDLSESITTTTTDIAEQLPLSQTKSKSKDSNEKQEQEPETGNIQDSNSNNNNSNVEKATSAVVKVVARVGVGVANMHNLSHKQYRNDLKQALDNFSKTREWADLIHNLSRLDKVFHKYRQIHKQYQSESQSHRRILPHTVQICKVLAMCLTPGRPAGVHLKTLNVYQSVFENLSRANLISDLGLWLCGLLPLASYASTRVRPKLLSLLDKYFISSLGVECRVALDGLISSLLPCIQEQNTALYFESINLLNRLMSNTHLPFFYSALMRSICACPQVRTPATHIHEFGSHPRQKKCVGFVEHPFPIGTV
jgi:hypothetical protein